MRKIVTVGLSISLLALVSWGSLPAGGIDPSGPFLASQNGDVNGDERVDLSDVISLINWLFNGGPSPVPLVCQPFADVQNGDVDANGTIDITDPIYMLNYMYLGGRPLRGGCPAE